MHALWGILVVLLIHQKLREREALKWFWFYFFHYKAHYDQTWNSKIISVYRLHPLKSVSPIKWREIRKLLASFCSSIVRQNEQKCVQVWVINIKKDEINWKCIKVKLLNFWVRESILLFVFCVIGRSLNLEVFHIKEGLNLRNLMQFIGKLIWAKDELNRWAENLEILEKDRKDAFHNEVSFS
jgi:hypothetical protein